MCKDWTSCGSSEDYLMWLGRSVSLVTVSWYGLCYPSVGLKLYFSRTIWQHFTQSHALHKHQREGRHSTKPITEILREEIVWAYLEYCPTLGGEGLNKLFYIIFPPLLSLKSNITKRLHSISLTLHFTSDLLKSATFHKDIKKLLRELPGRSTLWGPMIYGEEILWLKGYYFHKRVAAA